MWTPTRDATPPLRQAVLLFTHSGEVVIGQLDDRVPAAPLNLAYILIGPVTHWMPLPAKP